LTDSTQAAVTEVPEATTTGNGSDGGHIDTEDTSAKETEEASEVTTLQQQEETKETAVATEEVSSEGTNAQSNSTEHEAPSDEQAPQEQEEPHTQATILNAEERFNKEIEELLALLGLSQSMVKVTNEMIVPPEGDWRAPDGYRAIVNPGSVGQPRDGDPRAALMIYDTERGFTFYRIPYPFEKTQEKIIAAGLPQYLAARLAYGR
jgi:hypothetical protein